ncbi:MAG: cold shock domain-containing protein [Rhodanobacter sp.]
MRTHGTLTKWNDDRGFGFVEPATGSAEIFVHISAFPRDGVRPRIGELVSYEIDVRKDGKPQAVRILRPGAQQRSRRPQPKTARMPRRRGGNRLIGILGALLLAAMAALAYVSWKHIAPPPHRQSAAKVAPATAPVQLFSCDGRTRCSQMTSCAEATYFLDHCPGTTMDGNHDGVPCQSQWCGTRHDDWR